MSSYSRFIIKLLLFSVFVAGAILAWKHYGPAPYQTSTAWFSFAYFLLLTAGLHYILNSSSKGDPKKFVQSYMLATTLKLFASLAVVVIGMLINRAGAAPFAVTFLVLYFAFSIFEITVLMRDLKR
jgi:L-asparagine transporter-like permease